MMAPEDDGGVQSAVAASDAVPATCHRKMPCRDGNAAEEDDDTCTGMYRDYSHLAMTMCDNERKTFPLGGVASSSATRDPSFPAKLHMILSDPDFEDIVSWLPHGRSWKVVKTDLFEEIVLPRFFCHCKVASFMRQVNGWGFRRVRQGPDFNSYYHEYFLRGLPQLCSRMRRQSVAQSVRSLRARGKTKAHECEDEAVPDFRKISEEHPLPENPRPKRMETNLGTAATGLGASGDLLTSSAQQMARSFANCRPRKKQHRMTLLDRLDAQRKAVAKQQASRALASASSSASRSSLIESPFMHHEALPSLTKAHLADATGMTATALLRQAQQQQPSLASFAVVEGRPPCSTGLGLQSSVGSNPFQFDSLCGGGAAASGGTLQDILGGGSGTQAPTTLMDGSVLRGTVPQGHATVADAILRQAGISSLLSSSLKPREVNGGSGPVASLLSSSLDQGREESAFPRVADSLASLLSSQLRQDDILPRSGAGTVASLLSSSSGSYRSDQRGLLDGHGLGGR